MIDSVGTSHYDYDVQDRLTSYTPPVPSSHAPIEYTYNALGQKTSVTNGSFAVDYEYYANGWLKAVTDGTNPYGEYTYDQVGNRTRVDLGNTSYSSYIYDADPRYRVDAVKHYKKGSPDTLLAQMAYYDPENPGDLTKYRDGAGNPRAMKDWNPLVAYGYDANSRLVSAETTYAYDWVGNRNPSTCTYNAADELTASPSHQYAYDSAGNLTYEYDSSGQTLEKTYTYTAAGLLSSVVHAGIGTSSMTWDADGNRVSFTSSEGGTWQFVYDTTAGIPAVIEETGPVYYIREPNGSLIARIDGETVKYYHFDALGSTRLLTDAEGAVTDEYTYDAWGTLTNHTEHTGSVDQPYQFVGQLGYYTHVQDANMNLLQLGVRFYDTGTGRFTQVDPLREEPDLYAYCANGPTYGVDPRGLAPLFPTIPGPWLPKDPTTRRWLLCTAAYDACMKGSNAANQAGLKWCIFLCWLSTSEAGGIMIDKLIGDSGGTGALDDMCEGLAKGIDKACDKLNIDPYAECKRDCQRGYECKKRQIGKNCYAAFVSCMEGKG